MDSGRLRLSYRTSTPNGDMLDWRQGLGLWLERVRRPWQALPWEELPWLRWVLPLLIAIPALALIGWIHQAGQERLLQNSREWSQAPQLALVTPSPASSGEDSVAPIKREVLTWAPDPASCERRATDHPDVPADTPIRVKVLTIRAKVTAYTPYDHAVTHPAWADGIVAWHPNGRKRHVNNHKYGLATDWSQFPPGSTFIRVPGYMSKTFPDFPESFRVVDDACGRARRDRRYGRQPVIDVRFMTRYSAIDSRQGWGARELDVEVIVPADFTPAASLRPWIVKEEWHTYDADGKRAD